MNDLLHKAILIALEVHDGQRDKDGEPYILHPLRIMAKMETEEERIVAVLHDCLEDSPNPKWHKVQIAETFHPETYLALDHLTRQIAEPYADFIRRASENPLAKKIKILDLEDNLNTLRLSVLTPRDLQRLKKYHESLRFLLST